MRILWDEPKRQRNLLKHGLDFAVLGADFFLGSTILPGHDGRLVAVGPLEGRTIITVVFRPLGAEAISVISMRPASRRERTLP